ncbi:uncharacterized protein Z518_00441 [Rhinocladiella mackenziei CBS 650.93]|uniref:Uncharacterized protein n=1 Tax=Rhinocladiella mackenziei CBS 650.93 TaxID=1442369 RepID=A0A0D2G3Y9_9EURO|nr:uncharacterized protein Z518_00441 [Rhinocladiella mackenziei CBS 650.93]KIX09362.1 hypothetical protein Z518_00441 [Rhinocladiella mackenziei CBS 650.93]
MSLAGKVAIVSGSSSGIGAAVVQELSRRGATVAINYPFPSERDNAESVLKTLAPDTKAIIVEADLSSYEGPKILAQTVADAFSKIDILVNNAGVVLPAEVDDPDDSVIANVWDQTVNLNGRGVLLLTREVLKYLSPQNSRIVNIASGISRAPAPKQTIYAGSKGMVEAFTRCWARELPRKYGCTVNAVAPGPVGTQALYSAPQAVIDDLKPVIENTPVASRLAKPEEIAWTVAMLCEEEAGWLNGTYIPVAGGIVLG